MADTMAWRKASRSANGGNTCVEVARRADKILARDSKDPSGPNLAFYHDVWMEFAHRVKDGWFDR